MISVMIIQNIRIYVGNACSKLQTTARKLFMLPIGTIEVENRDTCKERIMIPVGLIQDKTDKFCVKNGAGRQTQKVSYRQHAVDLAFAITVWKSQRGTFKKALVLLEGSHDAAKWCFEHLYMAYSRMPIETCFSCFPLSSSRILDSDNSIIVCLNDCFYIRGRYMWTSWRESLYT